MGPAATPRFKRVLLKLSGEALMGSSEFGICPERLKRLTGELVEAHQLGVGVNFDESGAAERPDRLDVGISGARARQQHGFDVSDFHGLRLGRQLLSGQFVQ